MDIDKSQETIGKPDGIEEASYTIHDVIVEVAVGNESDFDTATRSLADNKVDTGANLLVEHTGGEISKGNWDLLSEGFKEAMVHPERGGIHCDRLHSVQGIVINYEHSSEQVSSTETVAAIREAVYAALKK